MLAAAYQTNVTHNTWTLLCQSPVGNGTLQYQGFEATGPVEAKFRTYIAASQQATPSNSQIRHTYTTSFFDRSALVIDRAESYSNYVFLECLQQSGSTQAFDGVLIGGA